MYKQGIINNFYRELFSTEYYDTASATQNLKTDYFFEHSIDNSDESFEKWFNNLIECYTKDCDINKQALLKAISNCHEFVQDMREEFESLYESCGEAGFDDDVE